MGSKSLFSEDETAAYSDISSAKPQFPIKKKARLIRLDKSGESVDRVASKRSNMEAVAVCCSLL
jgi:hypothetical protein